MSQDDHDFDEFLRRLLREEVDAVQPAGDGLERIRARLTRPRPLPVAWVMAVSSGAWHRVLAGAESAAAWAAALPGAARVRLPRGGRLRGWRSPAVLAACAAVAVAAGVLALTPLPRQAMSGTAALFRSFGGVHGGAAGHGGGQAEGGGSPQPVPRTSSSAPARRAHQQPSASPSPRVAPSPAPDPAPGASVSPTPSATPTPTPSSSPCPSASPSPSSGSTPDPGSGGCPTPTPTPTAGPTTGPTSSPTPTPDPANQ
jgi:hypothetical protein